jgi:hypothetical protein
MAKRKYAWIKQLKNWVNLYNRTQKNLAEGITPKPKGRPRKDGNRLILTAELCSEALNYKEAIRTITRAISIRLPNDFWGFGVQCTQEGSEL